MLRCPYCRITISTRTEVCPLCHVRLRDVGNSEEDIKRTARAYPPREKLKPLSGSLFDKIYLFAWLSLSIAMIVVEAALTRRVRFSWIAVAFLIYLYFLFRILIRGGEYFPQKVTAHALILSVAIYTLRGVLPEPEIIVEYLLPTLYLISNIAIAVFLIINYKRPNRAFFGAGRFGRLQKLRPVARYHGHRARGHNRHHHLPRPYYNLGTQTQVPYLIPLCGIRYNSAAPNCEIILRSKIVK